MSNDVCGSTNTQSGEPCQFSPGDSCPWHDEDTKTPEPGRPTKLTKETQEKIAADIERGRSMTSAARKQGITPKTVHNWMQRGEAELEAGKDNIYTEFFQRLTRARGYGEEWYFEAIADLAEEQGDHRFLASLMKQRYPDGWEDTDTGVEADNVTIELSDDVAETWPEQ